MSGSSPALAAWRTSDRLSLPPFCKQACIILGVEDEYVLLMFTYDSSLRFFQELIVRNISPHSQKNDDSYLPYKLSMPGLASPSSHPSNFIAVCWNKQEVLFSDRAFGGCFYIVFN